MMRRPTTLDLSSNPFTLYLSNVFVPRGTPSSAQSPSKQHEEAPETKMPPRETLLSSPPVPAPPAPANPYDPAEYYRGRALWSQCAKPDLLQFFADFEDYQSGWHSFTAEEVYETILEALKSAKQRPKDAQRFIPEDFRKIVDERGALPDHQWAVVDAALYLGKCCFRERTVAGAQISFQPADLKDTKFRNAVMMMGISGIRDMGPWLGEKKKREQHERDLELTSQRAEAGSTLSSFLRERTSIEGAYVSLSTSDDSAAQTSGQRTRQHQSSSLSRQSELFSSFNALSCLY